MSDRDALLRYVLEHPADDTARLVYADWLQEHDQEARAEFIRAQVAAAAGEGVCWKRSGLPGAPTRFRDLLAAEPWASPEVMAAVRRQAGYVGAVSSTAAVLWRRGFVEAVLLSGVSLVPVLDGLRRHPVREVLLSGIPNNTLRRLLPPDLRDLDLGLAYFSGEPSRRHMDLTRMLRHLLPTVEFAAYELARPGEKHCPFRYTLSAAQQSPPT